MHYYQRNIGDYARDTGHLSVLEHGLYVLMLDWYYLNERPITDFDLKRISRGMVDEARTVLCEYFKETEDGWIHSYADRVIEAYHQKAEKNRKNGQMGGRPKADGNPEETQTVSERNPAVTLTNNKAKALCSVPPHGFPLSGNLTRIRRASRTPRSAGGVTGWTLWLTRSSPTFALWLR